MFTQLNQFQIKLENPICRGMNNLEFSLWILSLSIIRKFICPATSSKRTWSGGSWRRNSHKDVTSHFLDYVGLSQKNMENTKIQWLTKTSIILDIIFPINTYKNHSKPFFGSPQHVSPIVSSSIGGSAIFGTQASACALSTHARPKSFRSNWRFATPSEAYGQVAGIERESRNGSRSSRIFQELGRLGVGKVGS